MFALCARMHKSPEHESAGGGGEGGRGGEGATRPVPATQLGGFTRFQGFRATGSRLHTFRECRRPAARHSPTPPPPRLLRRYMDTARFTFTSRNLFYTARKLKAFGVCKSRI